MSNGALGREGVLDPALKLLVFYLFPVEDSQYEIGLSHYYWTGRLYTDPKLYIGNKKSNNMVTPTLYITEHPPLSVAEFKLPIADTI